MQSPSLAQIPKKDTSPWWITAAMLLWLAAQMLALVASAARFGLSARFPQPAERVAVEQMLIVQIAAATLLFPLLLRDWQTSALAAAIVWPMLHLAALLSSTSMIRVFPAGCFVCCWLATLAIWQRVLTKQTSQLIGVAIASLLTFGGPILSYLRADFSTGANPIDLTHDNLLGPINGALSQFLPDHPNPIAWLVPLIPLLIGTAILAAKKFKPQMNTDKHG